MLTCSKAVWRRSALSSSLARPLSLLCILLIDCPFKPSLQLPSCWGRRPCLEWFFCEAPFSVAVLLSVCAVCTTGWCARVPSWSLSRCGHCSCPLCHVASRRIARKAAPRFVYLAPSLCASSIWLPQEILYFCLLAVWSATTCPDQNVCCALLQPKKVKGPERGLRHLSHHVRHYYGRVQHAENDTSKCNTYNALCRSLSSDKDVISRTGSVRRRWQTESNHEILVTCQEPWTVAAGWRHKSGQCKDLVLWVASDPQWSRSKCIPWIWTRNIWKKWIHWWNLWLGKSCCCAVLSPQQAFSHDTRKAAKFENL